MQKPNKEKMRLTYLTLTYVIKQQLEWYTENMITSYLKGEFLKLKQTIMQSNEECSKI